MKNWKMIFKKIRGIAITFVLCFVIPFLVFFVTSTIRDRLEKLEDGYTLCGVDLSRLDGLEAEKKIENALKDSGAPLQIALHFKIRGALNQRADCVSDKKMHKRV